LISDYLDEESPYSLHPFFSSSIPDEGAAITMDVLVCLQQIAEKHIQIKYYPPFLGSREFSVYMEKQDQIDMCEEDAHYNEWERQKAKLMKQRKPTESYDMPS
jgi:hypothetical protein